MSDFIKLIFNIKCPHCNAPYDTKINENEEGLVRHRDIMSRTTVYCSSCDKEYEVRTTIFFEVFK